MTQTLEGRNGRRAKPAKPHVDSMCWQALYDGYLGSQTSKQAGGHLTACGSIVI